MAARNYPYRRSVELAQVYVVNEMFFRIRSRHRPRHRCQALSMKSVAYPKDLWNRLRDKFFWRFPDQ